MTLEGLGVLLRRLAAFAFVFAGFAVASGITGPAEARGPRHAAMIMDANTGAILHNDDGDQLRHPASLTKMMTLYLTFETIETGRLSMSSQVKMSQEAASAPPSNLGLEAGEEISVADAIKALITKSANDVAVALAEKIGGSEANFVRLMNAKAKALGMSKTNFENASGLPNPDQVTTARDMITLGLRLQDDYPQHYQLFSMRVFRYGRSSYRNHNTLMNHFAGIDGIKTGYTRASGFNLVSSVRRGGKHLVGAVFGGRSAGTRNAEMRLLLTRAMNRASTLKTRKPAPMLISKLKSEPKMAVRPAKPKPEIKIAAAPPPQLAAAPKPVPVAAAKPKPVPVPQVVAEAAHPHPAPRAEVAATETTPMDTEPAAEPSPEPAAAPAPVEVAKVRRVMVEPRVRKPVSPDETTDMAPELEVMETIIAKTTPAAPSTPAMMLGASGVGPPEAADATPAANTTAVPPVAPAPIASAEPARTKAVPAVAKLTKTAAISPRQNSIPEPRAPPAQRGKAPSSLEAQAAVLQSPQRVAALQPASAPAAHFEIQIGAYASVDEAQRSLNAVQARAGNLLGSHPSVTLPVSKSGRQIYRARFRGFDAASAASTCQQLRKQAFDCFVMTAE